MICSTGLLICWSVIIEMIPVSQKTGSKELSKPISERYGGKSGNHQTFVSFPTLNMHSVKIYSS